MDGEGKRVLGGVCPINLRIQRLTDHAIDQGGQQPGDVPGETSLDALPLNPNVFHRIVQAVNIWAAVPRIEVGVLAVQQFMHHISNVALQHGLGHDGVRRHILEQDATCLTDRSRGHIR